jgi:hypothetical protein
VTSDSLAPLSIVKLDRPAAVGLLLDADWGHDGDMTAAREGELGSARFGADESFARSS